MNCDYKISSVNKIFMRKMVKPVTNSIKEVCEEVTKTMMINSEENNKAIENLNSKFSETLNDMGIKAFCLLSCLSKITNPEYTSQFKLLKDLSSNKVNDSLINKTMPVTLYNYSLTLRDTDKKFEVNGELSKTITNKNYKIDLASLVNKKLMYEFAQETHFHEMALGNKKSTRDKSVEGLQKSPAVMVSGVSIKILTENTNELCDGLN